VNFMRRVNKLLGIPEEESVRYPSDIVAIREYIVPFVPEFFNQSAKDIEEMWDSFSGFRDAGWLFVNEETLPQFRDWLLEDV
jgi:hypothetical protein